VSALLRSSTLARSLAFSLVAAALGSAAGAQTLPVADAGDDQTLPCAPAAGAEVTLDGTGSSDPDDPLAVLTYSWTGDALGVGVSVDGATPSVTLPPGVHVLTLTVDDGVDGTATDEVSVTVVADTEPPTLVLSTTAMELWPPNHKYRVIDVADVVGTVSDACDTELSAADVVFARGTSDEAEDGTGDGSTLDDVLFGEGCASAYVRSERAGPQDGRVYELTLSVQDAAGLAGEAVLTVSVPHDRGKKGAAVDSGDAYEVAGECGPVELCPPEPSETCEDAGQASVELHDGKKGPSLRWKARGYAADDSDFEDDDADYQLCVYTDDGVAAVLADDPAAPAGGWKHGRGSMRFHGRKAGPHAGVSSARLGAKKGAGALQLGVAGDDLTLPALPLAGGTTLTLQLVASDGACLGSEFDAPKTNDDDEYEAETGE
jgi:hypothetical protein